MSELSEKEKRVLFITQLLLDNKTDNKAVFKSLLAQLQENYDAESEQTFLVIPLVGTLYMKYNNESYSIDPVTKDEKRDVDILFSFIPNKNLKILLTDLVDGNDTSIEKEMYKKIEYILSPNFRKE